MRGSSLQIRMRLPPNLSTMDKSPPYPIDKRKAVFYFHLREKPDEKGCATLA